MFGSKINTHGGLLLFFKKKRNIGLQTSPSVFLSSLVHVKIYFSYIISLI